MVNPSRGRRSFTFAGAGIALGLASCAVEEPRPPAAAAAPAGRGLLVPWLSITGGWRLDARLPLPAARALGGRVNFVQPVGVAARNDMLLVADAGARTLWQVDRQRDAMAPFAAFTGGVHDHGASLQLGNDLGAWVALPADHMVVQLDARGRIVRRWISQVDAPRPVAVAVPEDRSRVLVGDAATARVLVFDPLGQLLGVLGGHRPAALQSVTAMALGPRGLYVLDRLAQQVVVLDPGGVPVEVIGENHLVQPRALAVDASGRVFVGDEQDQRIKVFRGRELLASVGGQGPGPDRFGRIEAMALDGNLLYVADSVNMRVQVLMVAPQALEGPGVRP